jgi:hypothetical protein
MRLGSDLQLVPAVNRGSVTFVAYQSLRPLRIIVQKLNGAKDQSDAIDSITSVTKEVVEARGVNSTRFQISNLNSFTPET